MTVNISTTNDCYLLLIIKTTQCENFSIFPSTVLRFNESQSAKCHVWQSHTWFERAKKNAKFRDVCLNIRLPCNDPNIVRRYWKLKLYCRGMWRWAGTYPTSSSGPPSTSAWWDSDCFSVDRTLQWEKQEINEKFMQNDLNWSNKDGDFHNLIVWMSLVDIISKKMGKSFWPNCCFKVECKKKVF